MKIAFPYRVTMKFPGDMEYIPSVRKFISEMLQVSNFSPKFAYRSEIIIDEICNNAVTYGCAADSSDVELTCEVHQERIEFNIKDKGGSPEDLQRLRRAVNVEPAETKLGDRRGLGMEIVRMLSEAIDLEIDDSNLTSVHVVRRREDVR